MTALAAIAVSAPAWAAKTPTKPAPAPAKARYGRDRLRPDWVPPANESAQAPTVNAKVSATATAQIAAVRASLPPVVYGGVQPTDAELGRGFAGNVHRNLELLQQREGIERRGVATMPVRSAPIVQQAPQVTLYDQLAKLDGVELIDALQLVGREIMFSHPVGSSVEELRDAYREVIHFISARTTVPVEHIYRVMDLESSGGQYWVTNPSGACGLVQVRPIALEELQRLVPEEFGGVQFKQIAQNPALNLYAGMRYAQLKGQDWDHYSGGANGYARYVLTGSKL